MFGSVVKNGGGYMHHGGISCISIVETSSSLTSSYVDVEEINGSIINNNNVNVDYYNINNDNNNNNDAYSSSSTSSIGKNSDDVSGNSMDNNNNNSEESEEVQSSYKSPLDAMEALEEVLPIRRGISRFYNGKSKSFASLAVAASVKDMSKPENAYARRRRNLLACSLSWDKNRNFPLRSNNCGISKRVTNSSRTTLALAVAMNSSSASESNDSSNPDSDSLPKSTALISRFHPRFKELHGVGLSSPRGSFSTWRSFSLADLQECDNSANIASTTRRETKQS